MKTSPAIAAACLMLTGANAFAHGYLLQPEARGYLCKTSSNVNCGAIQWEPQSLEALSGFPEQGPADGSIAAAGLPQFSELNEQSSSRWTKRPIQAGVNTFKWQLTAFHKTRNWRYFITKANWDPNQKLSRAAFDLAPFCTIDGGNAAPPATVSHQCTVPQRSGYHVILAVWQIADTVNSFYNVADVQFKDGTTPQPGWVERGTINPSVDLTAGDSVATRVFDAAGEHPDMETKITIASDSEGLRNNWAHRLASQINAEQTQLRAGQLGQDGKITPVYGQNPVYAQAGSPWVRVETRIVKTDPPSDPGFSVNDVRDTYAIKGGQLTIDFSVNGSSAMDLSAYVYDQAGVAKGYATAVLNERSVAMSICLDRPKAGAHKLVLKAVVKNGGAVLQQTYPLQLTDADGAAYAYVFPASLASYRPGTKVLQPKDGKVYTCKPFPQGGWCAQWSASATHYEPGVGSNWRDAWLEP